jgi:Leucine-rich repeat (LRR) protein
MENLLDLIRNVRENSLETLDYSGKAITEIPLEVFELTNLKLLRLRSNKISSIPKEINKLINLVELNLIDNALETIPIELYQLENLEVLFLGKNQISSFPSGVSNLTNLRVLNLRDNQIVNLPEDVGQLENLRTLFLKNNSIKVLPKTFGGLLNLKDFFIDGNPIEYPPKKIISAGLMRIMIFFLIDETTNKTHSGFSFKIPKEMRIAVKQYLTYFTEYVEVSKGKKIKFEVKSTEDGVSVEVEESDSIEELNGYFNEYLGFVKNNIDDLAPKIEVVIDDHRKDLFVLELKTQVQHFKQQVEFKNFQLKYLETQLENVQNLLLAQSSRSIPIYVNALSSSNSKSESLAEQNTSVVTEIKIELPKLQNEILNLKTNLPIDASQNLKEEMTIIDNELLSNEVLDIEDIDKKPLKRINRLFDQLSDKNSELSALAEKSIKFKESIQGVGKSYNKIAQLLGLPNIPNVLLEI